MNKISNIGSLLKRIYRDYSLELLSLLQIKGFTDLRPSFLEILLHICESEGSSIKEIGFASGLKKQTMTSHLNELVRRGYIIRKMGEKDKREQNIFLTAYGEKFKLNLFESIDQLQKSYSEVVGDVELDRIELLLKNFHRKISEKTENILF